MYGNVETALDKAWGPGEGSSLPLPPDEDPYEPLDPSPTLPGKPRPSPPGGLWVTPGVTPGVTPRVTPRVALVALGVALVASVTSLLVLGTLWGRRISALEAALEAEKAKETPPTAASCPQASGPFLLFNEHHSRCVTSSGRTLTLSPCSPSSPSQRFQWLRGERLQHVATGLCVVATAATERALVRLGQCREASRLQRWHCGPGELLALAGTELHFNFGHSAEGEVMLFGGKGEWSRWKRHGSAGDVCSGECSSPCSKGWMFFRNSCYFFSQSVASWDNSRFFCSALGSKLLEVDDAEEKRQVQARLRAPAWLGIRDWPREGIWSRGDGTELSPNCTWWHRDEPNGGSLENCAAVGQDGLWADYPCETSLAWVCEGPP